MISIIISTGAKCLLTFVVKGYETILSLTRFVGFAHQCMHYCCSTN